MITKNQRLRTEAIQKVCDHLKANIDWQEIVRDIGNDSRYAPLLAGKSDHEQEKYLMGLINTAEMQLGWR